MELKEAKAKCKDTAYWSDTVKVVNSVMKVKLRQNMLLTPSDEEWNMCGA